MAVSKESCRGPLDQRRGTHFPQGIPLLAPEVVLLFKAKLMRTWDAADFDTAAAVMGLERRSWLTDALEQSHPGHEWITALA